MAAVMIRTLRELAAGAIAAVPVDATRGSYRSFPERRHVEQLRARGHRLL